MKVDQDSGIALAPATCPAPMPFVYKPYHQSQIDAISKEFYVSSMAVLNAANIPFLVGGAYAFSHYAGIDRHTKDFDIFVKKEDAERVLETLMRELNCKIDRTFPHWLYKAIAGVNFIDIIFSSGNGIAVVDDVWFEKAATGIVLGETARVVPAEEMIWSKGFIMERERYDGADIAHIFRGWGHNMDWPRLIARFDSHWRVLYSHIVLFGYIYPDELDSIPTWVMEKLSKRLITEHKSASKPISDILSSPSLSSSILSSSVPPSPALTTYNYKPETAHLCQGTLLSRQQYLKDVAEWKYEDARILKRSNNKQPIMSEQDVAHWTASAFNHGGDATA